MVQRNQADRAVVIDDLCSWEVKDYRKTAEYSADPETSYCSQVHSFRSPSIPKQDRTGCPCFVLLPIYKGNSYSHWDLFHFPQIEVKARKICMQESQLLEACPCMELGMNWFLALYTLCYFSFTRAFETTSGHWIWEWLLVSLFPSISFADLHIHCY